MRWVVLMLTCLVLVVEAQESLMDLFNIVGDLAGSLATGCTHTCQNGAVPLANPSHIPTANGCGSYGIRVDLTEYPEMTSCCNSHDKCYDTCGEEKRDCDHDFQRCLHKMCKKMKKKDVLKDNQYRGCRSTVDLLYGGLLALGCDAYQTAQGRACICPTGSHGPNPEL